MMEKTKMTNLPSTVLGAVILGAATLVTAPAFALPVAAVVAEAPGTNLQQVRFGDRYDHHRRDQRHGYGHRGRDHRHDYDRHRRGGGPVGRILNHL